MKLLKPELHYSPTSIVKEYVGANLQLCRHSECSLEKLAIYLTF
jgi:hypothetical protein